MITFSNLVELHKVSMKASRRSPATIIWYEGNLKVFTGWCAANDIADAIPSPETLDKYIAFQHAQGLRPATVHARFRSVAAVLNFAEKRRIITRDENPISIVGRPRLPRERPRYVTPQVFDSLMRAIVGDSWTDHRDRLILQVLFFSGLRIGELVALQVDDIDLKKGEIFVRRGKGAKARMVPAHPELGKYMLPYLYTRPSTSSVLFLSASGANRKAKDALTSEGLRSMLKRRCKEAGIESWNAHAFRHGWAMWMRNAGADLSDIAAAMGHTTTQVTQMYYAFTLAPTVHKAYDKALGRMLDESRGE